MFSEAGSLKKLVELRLKGFERVKLEDFTKRLRNAPKRYCNRVELLILLTSFLETKNYINLKIKATWHHLTEQSHTLTLEL